SFISGLGRGPEDGAIVQAISTLAHTLNMEVTAEGVETADQLARLRELGCDIGQGSGCWQPAT
ncbi:MAG: EAL domain-containing protein, partial [Solirubrobacterales bacterium]|nr:EAL domain-containing protein [Solirubrobacterales bacterium]